jgi:hypothetical protein
MIYTKVYALKFMRNIQENQFWGRRAKSRLYAQSHP